eukprot:IDg71t1
MRTCPNAFERTHDPSEKKPNNQYLLALITDSHSVAEMFSAAVTVPTHIVNKIRVELAHRDIFPDQPTATEERIVFMLAPILYLGEYNAYKRENAVGPCPNFIAQQKFAFILT